MDLLEIAKSGNIDLFDKHGLAFEIALKQNWTLDGTSYDDFGEGVQQHNYKLMVIELEEGTPIYTIGELTANIANRFQTGGEYDMYIFDEVSQGMSEVFQYVDDMTQYSEYFESDAFTYIDDVYIKKEFRGKGIAEQFVKSVMDMLPRNLGFSMTFALQPGALPRAKDEYPSDIDLSKVDEKLRNFYSKCGFTPYKDTKYMVA